MRGLGDIQVQIMVACQEDEARGATFSIAALRQQLVTDRGLLRCDLNAFNLSFRRALEGLVRRGHLIWGDVKRSRVRRGPVRPVLPGLSKRETEEFMVFVRRELARPSEKEEEVKDYLTDESAALDPIKELQRIAERSNDIGARITAIRRLAMYLGRDGPPEPPTREAKWRVISVAPGEAGHRDYVPPEDDAA